MSANWQNAKMQNCKKIKKIAKCQLTGKMQKCKNYTFLFVVLPALLKNCKKTIFFYPFWG